LCRWERRARLLGLRREGDFGIEEAADNTDGQAGEVQPGEEIVSADEHA